MSHLIWIYTVCLLVFEFSYDIALRKHLKCCRHKFCCLLFGAERVKMNKITYRGDNSFQENFVCLHRGFLLKERICSLKEQILSFQNDSILKGPIL